MPMKKEFLLDPLHGVGPVRFGMRRDDVLAAFGPPAASFYKTPDSRYPTDAWFESGFQVAYEGDEATVAFIELSNDAGLEAFAFGLPVFATPAAALVPAIERHAELDRADPELGYVYTFPDLELAFWRPDDDDDDTPYFATVGIGRAGYYAA